MGKCKKVAIVEDFYTTIKEVHEKELLHAGYHKTYEKVVSLNLFQTPTDLIHLLLTQVMTMYYGIPRSVVLKFTSMCTTCQLRALTTNLFENSSFSDSLLVWWNQIVYTY